MYMCFFICVEAKGKEEDDTVQFCEENTKNARCDVVSVKRKKCKLKTAS